MKVYLEHITKCFSGEGNKRKITAANDLTFEIPDGKLVGLLGPSGCGKSTVLNLICGLETPTEGRIYFNDRDVTDIPPEKRGVGLVFQSYALYPHMTALQNILFPLQNMKRGERLSKKEMTDRAHEVAKLVQIDELCDRLPGQMSGGQQQRVAIARALARMPQVLLLDEPLSNLDARLRLQTREEIRRIQRATGITTVFVTHDQEEAMSISDVIVVLKNGTLQQMEAPQKVYDNPVNLFVARFLGNPPVNVFSAEIKNGALYIGEDRIFGIDTQAKGAVTVGIRPEGMVPDDNGRFGCMLESIEVMGRDVSMALKNENSRNITVRAIVSGDVSRYAENSRVRFALKPEKVFLFDSETEERLYYTIKGE